MLSRQNDTSAQVAMMKLAAQSRANMITRARNNRETYTEWKIFHELRQLLVFELEYCTWEQFNTAMELMTEQYLEEEKAI